MSRKESAPLGADDVLDVIVGTLGREAKRIERQSKRRQLMPEQIDALVRVAGVVGKVVELQSNPFSPAFVRRLQKASDEELEQAKRRLGAIETTAT